MSSTEERIRKMWYIYTMQYYLVVKNNDILDFTCKDGTRKKNILSEVTQTQRDEHGIDSLISE